MHPAAPESTDTEVRAQAENGIQSKLGNCVRNVV